MPFLLISLLWCQSISTANAFHIIPHTSAFSHLHHSKKDTSTFRLDLSKNDEHEKVLDRREMFKSIFATSILISSSISSPVSAAAIDASIDNSGAIESPPPTSTSSNNNGNNSGNGSNKNVDRKPFAPLESLLPAMRVKLTIEKSISLTTSLISNSNDASSNSSQKATTTTTAILNELSQLLLTPQNYVQSLTLQGVPAKPADLYLESYKPMKGDLPFQRMLIQNGDVSTWKRLKQKEKQQEQSNEIRAALNAYTDKLSFSGDAYLLNVDKATRSSMVREDRLPDIKQVITSDMGMRYLYRNQLLTAMEDVKAELEYQLRVKDVDGADLMDLLMEARKAMDRWLSFIDENDVREAIECINRTENEASMS